LLPVEFRDRPVPLYYLFIDTGLLAQEVARLVRIGDLVSFAQSPLEINSQLLVGHSLDNRASVAALSLALQGLQDRALAWDVWAAATTQEEINYGGAMTSAFALRPSLAVAIDVTFATGPGSPSHKTFPIGKGIILGWGPNVHPALFRAFKELAELLEIPHKVEVMPRMSGTDAAAFQVAAEGIPSMVILIPLRYMHTPVEMVSLKDIQRAGRLLAEFAAQLDENFLDKLVFDEK
jgi:endoglucanase